MVALGTYAPLFDKAMSNVVEVKARGAEVLALTTEDFREKMEKTADATVSVPVTHPMLQPSLGVVPLQLFAYYVALQRGCDIDKPRNLAKSVTVESRIAARTIWSGRFFYLTYIGNRYIMALSKYIEYLYKEEVYGGR